MAYSNNGVKLRYWQIQAINKATGSLSMGNIFQATPSNAQDQAEYLNKTRPAYTHKAVEVNNAE